MTMHIERAWLSTTSTKKRPVKITKARQKELEQGWRDRNVRLREMGLPKDTFEQYMEWVYGAGKKTKRQAIDNAKFATTNTTKNTSGDGNPPNVSTVTQVYPGNVYINARRDNWVTGPVSSKPSPVYTGTKMIGVGIMHKSNLVPIFSDDEAKDISRMRR